MEDNQVALRIKQIRLEHGLTMEDFGVKIDNAHKSLVSKWEKGLSLPNKKRLKLIADMGNITVDELINGNFEEKVILIAKNVFEDFKQENHYLIEDNPNLEEYFLLSLNKHISWAIDRKEYFDEKRFKENLYHQLQIDLDLGNRDLNSITLYAYRQTDQALENILVNYHDDLTGRKNLQKEEISLFLDGIYERNNLIKEYIDEYREKHNLIPIKKLDE